MSATTLAPSRPATPVAAPVDGRAPPPLCQEAAALAFGVVLVLWTLLPIYNMVMVALEPHGDVFTEHIWPPHPSLASFWIVVSQGYWYLEYFWHQFGNSLYIGVAVDVA